MGLLIIALSFFFAATLSLAYKAIYNVCFHPLHDIPGPLVWATFRLRHIISLWQGRLVYDVFDLHQKYGDIVRIAPDEVSFSNGKAWNDIYCHRQGHKPFSKDPTWWGEVPGREESIVSASTNEKHERLRKILSHCFTDAALRDSEPSIQQHVNKLIERLVEQTEKSTTRSAVVNIVDWYMFTTFDIIGDLSFGSSFQCLEKSTYHPWVLEIFSYFKVGCLFSSLKFYPFLAKVLMFSLPPRMIENQERNYQWACSRVQDRLNMETGREDFMDKVLPFVLNQHNFEDKNHQQKKISIGELKNNFYVLTVAGSETCGTVLSGTTNYLVKTPEALKKLTLEVRETFRRPEDMSFDSLSKLSYLNAVIAEGLRLCPPVGGALAHVVPAGGDTVCGVWLPEGTHVGIHQWSTYRSPSNFSSPAIFAPERWLENACSDPLSPYYQDQRSSVQAFSIGSWSCIGKNLGLAELRLILARMVWNFEMSSGGKDVDWTKQKQYVLIEKDDFEVRLVSRNTTSI